MSEQQYPRYVWRKTKRKIYFNLQCTDNFFMVWCIDDAIFQLILPPEVLKHLSIEIVFPMQNLIVKDLKT